MEFINHTSFTVAPLAGRIGFPGHSLTFIVKGTFDMNPNQAAVVSEDQLFPTGDAFYPDDDEGKGSCRYASDFAFFKPRADLLLVGKCHPPDGRPVKACRVRIKVGGHSKTLVVFGDRYWTPAPRAISDPEPFTEMDLRYENSFGGQKDPRNPVGRGISKIVRASGQRVRPLPNIEDAGNLIDSPASRPEPAGFGPVGMMWEQRYKKLGTYKGAWLRTRWPWYPLDFDWAFFNTAPAGMQADGYLKGDEPLCFENLHPRHPVYETRLPGIFPRVFINKEDASEPGLFHFVEIPMNLDTLWVEMEAEKLVLVWRGVTETRSEDYEELGHAFIVSENRHTEPRSKAACHELFLRLLDEADEMDDEPESRAHEIESASTVDIEAEIGKAEAAARAAMLAAGIDPDRDLPEPDEADKEKEAELLKSLGFEKTEPPPAITRERVQQMVANGEDLSGENLQGIDLSGLDLSGGIFREAVLAGVALEKCILTGADFSKADMSATILVSANAHSVNFTDTDLTGADLSGSDLTGAALDDAILDNVNLRHAVMENTSARGASFVEADLSHARLVNCTCPAADFSKSRIQETDFHGSELTDAGFEGAAGTGANFSFANLNGLRASGNTDFRKGIFRGITALYSVWESALLDEADFSHAVMEGANLASASMRETRFFGADLRFARLSKSDLTRAKCVRVNLFQATLEKADLTETDFSAASLYGAEFLDATVNRTIFKQTNLKMTKLVDLHERP